MRRWLSWLATPNDFGSRFNYQIERLRVPMDTIVSIVLLAGLANLLQVFGNKFIAADHYPIREVIPHYDVSFHFFTSHWFIKMQRGMAASSANHTAVQRTAEITTASGMSMGRR
jgi:hypothetical protein